MVPHERALVKRLENKPFALIGVNCDKDLEACKEKNKAKGITWRSFWDGQDGQQWGPIGKAWYVRSWPTIYVLDAKGIIRFKNVRGEALDAAVDELLAEMEREEKKGG